MLDSLGQQQWRGAGDYQWGKIIAREGDLRHLHVEMYKTMPIQPHAVALFAGRILPGFRILAMAALAAIFLDAGNHEKLRAGDAAAAQEGGDGQSAK